MDVELKGQGLTAVVTDSTGLPEGFAKATLQKLIESSGLQEENLTLEDLREIAANLLQELTIENFGQ